MNSIRFLLISLSMIFTGQALFARQEKPHFTDPGEREFYRRGEHRFVVEAAREQREALFEKRSLQSYAYEQAYDTNFITRTLRKIPFLRNRLKKTIDQDVLAATIDQQKISNEAEQKYKNAVLKVLSELQTYNVHVQSVPVPLQHENDCGVYATSFLNSFLKKQDPTRAAVEQMKKNYNKNRPFLHRVFGKKACTNNLSQDDLEGICAHEKISQDKFTIINYKDLCAIPTMGPTLRANPLTPIPQAMKALQSSNNERHGLIVNIAGHWVTIGFENNQRLNMHWMNSMPKNPFYLEALRACAYVRYQLDQEKNQPQQ